jgi:hypothetical protein
MQDRELPEIDEAEILGRARGAAERLWERF